MAQESRRICGARFWRLIRAGKRAKLFLHQLAERQVCDSESCPSRRLALAPLGKTPIERPEAKCCWWARDRAIRTCSP